MLLQWRSVPTRFRLVSPDNQDLVADDIEYDIEHQQKHTLELSWAKRLAGTERLGRAVAYALGSTALFASLFWLLPALITSHTQLDVRADVPPLAMLVIALLASYVGAGHHVMDRWIREATRAQRGWGAAQEFAWVHEADWESFLVDVEQQHRRRKKHAVRAL